MGFVIDEWSVLHQNARVCTPTAWAPNAIPLIELMLIRADVRKDVEIVDAAKAPVAWALPAKLIFVVTVAWIIRLELTSVPTEPAGR
jgi:hypothetical protein